MKKETAILVALLGKPKQYYGGYIKEKITAVLEHGADERILDSENLMRFNKLMKGEEVD